MNKNTLNQLYKECGLLPEDIAEIKFGGGRSLKIISRSGIEKIQRQKKISVQFEAVHTQPDFVVIKATGKMGQTTIETFGEASPENTKQKYPVAMAEKRALSRVVLKLAGLYETGHFGEDEEVAWTPKNGQQLMALELLDNAMLDDHNYTYARAQIQNGGDLTDVINFLKEHQRQSQTNQMNEQFNRFSK